MQEQKRKDQRDFNKIKLKQQNQTNQIIEYQLIGLNHYSKHSQNLILKRHLSTQFTFKKKNPPHMESEPIQIHLTHNKKQKNTHPTCSSSNGNSPSSQASLKINSHSKTITSFSTKAQSLMWNQSSQKVIAQISEPYMQSLQKRSFSQNELRFHISDEKQSTVYQRVRSMEEESHQPFSVLTFTEESNEKDHSQVLKTIQSQNQAIIKIQELTFSSENFELNQNLKFNQSQQTNKVTKIQPQTQCYSDLESQQEDNRPVPLYKDARSALYVWMRNLCIQLDMCLDVLALSMKYLDDYHITNNNLYDRNTFTQHAYAVIILASKMVNRRILTPKIVAAKIYFCHKELEEIQLKLIRMFNFELFSETFIKKLQRYLQKWEEECQSKGLKKRFSYFEQNLISFRRFYTLIKTAENYGRFNRQVSQQMFLDVFIKSLNIHERSTQQKNILIQILLQTFEMEEAGDKQLKKEMFKDKLKSSMIEEEDDNQNILIIQTFDNRRDTENYQNYNSFEKICSKQLKALIYFKSFYLINGYEWSTQQQIDKIRINYVN